MTAYSVSGGPSQSTTSGPDGAYIVATFGAGNYSLQFSDKLDVYAGGVYASPGVTLNDSLAKRIAVANSPVTGVDVVLKVGHSLSGFVRRADRSPVAGVRVQVQMCTKRASSDSVICSASNAAWTGHDGRYSLPNLGDGVYEVKFTEPRPDPAPGKVVPGLVLSGANISNFDLTAPSGWTTGAAIEGVVRTASGDPLPNVEVRADAEGSDDRPVVKTSPDGSYFIGLSAGKYTISFGAPMYAYAGLYGLAYQTSDATRIVLTTGKRVSIDCAIGLPAGRLWRQMPTKVGNIQVVATIDLIGSALDSYVSQMKAGAYESVFLAALGKHKADILDVAFAGDHPERIDLAGHAIGISATRYSGLTASQAIGAGETATREWYGGRCVGARAKISGKTVLATTCGGKLMPMYEYAHDDVVFSITAKDSATAAAAVAALP